MYVIVILKTTELRVLRSCLSSCKGTIAINIEKCVFTCIDGEERGHGCNVSKSDLSVSQLCYWRWTLLCYEYAGLSH